MLYVQSIKNKKKLIRHWSSLEIDMQEMKWKQCVWAIGHDCRLKLIVVETQARTDTSRHMYCNSATQLLLCVHNRLQKTVVESAQNATFMKGLLKVNNCSRQLLVTVQVRNSHVADSCCWHTQYFQTAVVDCAQTQYTLSMLTAVVDSAQYLWCWQVMMTVHNIYVAVCALG